MPRMNVRYSSSGWVVKYANFGENQTFGHQFRPFSDQFFQKGPNSDQVRPIRTIIGGTAYPWGTPIYHSRGRNIFPQTWPCDPIFFPPFFLDKNKGKTIFIYLFLSFPNKISRTYMLLTKRYWNQVDMFVTTIPQGNFFLNICRTYGLSIQRYWYHVDMSVTTIPLGASYPEWAEPAGSQLNVTIIKRTCL